MGIYTAQVGLLFILMIREMFVGKFTKREVKFFFVTIAILFATVAGIRNNIGKDFETYQNVFSYITLENIGNYREWLEPGFLIITITLKQLGLSPPLLFFSFAFLTYFFVLKGLYKINQYPMLSFFLYFLIFNIGYVYNVMRQGLAMAIFIFLILDIIEGNTKKVVFYGLFATSIHYSGIFILLGYVLRKYKKSKTLYIVQTSVLFLVFLFNQYIYKLFLKILPNILVLKLARYTDSFGITFDVLKIVPKMIPIILFLIYYDKLNEKYSDKFRFIFNYYFIGFAFFSIFSFQNLFATRVYMFTKVVEIILFPMLINIKINKYMKILILMLMVLLASSYFLAQLRSPVNYPFITIF